MKVFLIVLGFSVLYFGFIALICAFNCVCSRKTPKQNDEKVLDESE